MANTLTASRSQVIFGLCVPLAVLVGYFLAQPLESTSLAILVFVVTALLFPLLLRWYHPLLIISWNAAIDPYFLPGRPYLWMLFSVTGLIVALVNRSVDPDKRFMSGGGVPWALLFLALVLAATAATTGGMGARSLGSASYGGKKYFYILAAIAGYFALASRRIPAQRAKLYVSLFFLSAITALASNLAYMGGAKFYFLLDLFPSEFAMVQAVGTEAAYGGIPRIAGSIWASMAIACCLLALYGIRGVLDLRKPWRAALLVAAVVGGLLSGFRSFVVLMGLIVVVEFFLEGLHRTRWLAILLAAGVVGGGAMVTFVDKLPLSAQRALSFLPLDVHPIVRSDADHSTEWRLEMWRILLPEVPKYLLKGKGYALNPTDLYLSQESAARGLRPTSEVAIVAADYHNGPLSILIPFGIWGAVGFLWFLIAAGRVLYLNHRFGEVSLRNINTTLLALFVGRAIFFFLFFGSVDVDMFVFTGLVGLSVSLNGGVRVAPAVDQQPAWAGYPIA